MQQVPPEIKAMSDQLQMLLKENQELGEKKAKLIDARQRLGAQKSENEIVRDEINRLEPDSKVYKLIGPALIPQDQSDAKAIVQNRLEYINGELKRTDAAIADLENKQRSGQQKSEELFRKMQAKHSQIQRRQQQS
ncbi:prefoldin subunit, putative [Trypanosoma equiperdum]|uniref:Prefoldin subunit, putative n=4 Tax=Trypanozoon TaxID=39700 RepID=Q57VV5_TRYB2|nr:prefoldin subunit, putative [Trypanosoma brucei gambiense DAL972]XP_844732.1 prefoldin subunit, putative [Trypanosoma brucei brucei TREU927]AAX70259.1 prefoldin subunit, putative [Trypanosoma brucei]RHW72517.1 prefoldin subunit [Trypanosoma brucei equiperdum]SCU64464.1 prefoldin subunit, putative [Trypanosoma equiperdum]AAZ11173.1 prefoldin subunit, putative [Trypanosoma brucei brucei TREU927]CBH10923.1 prefoldin subunit, putative [Trypanosoma brucei gambiense DAL972]|eukprot:XP_011773210.1 prefoldin subunit, putative [Trypanosoma brucei gambiense DAL972]